MLQLASLTRLDRRPLVPQETTSGIGSAPSIQSYSAHKNRNSASVFAWQPSYLHDASKLDVQIKCEPDSANTFNELLQLSKYYVTTRNQCN